jgi:Transglutaminase-like superfamily
VSLLRGRLDALVVEALFFCWRFRLQLWFRPVPTLRYSRPPLAPVRASVDPAAVSSAVSSAARFVPAATCLPQALAVERMLLRRGIACNVEIGVSVENGFAAHAWVVSGGATVHGASERRFQPLRPQVRF